MPRGVITANRASDPMTRRPRSISTRVGERHGRVKGLPPMQAVSRTYPDAQTASRAFLPMAGIILVTIVGLIVLSLPMGMRHVS